MLLDSKTFISRKQTEKVTKSLRIVHNTPNATLWRFQWNLAAENYKLTLDENFKIALDENFKRLSLEYWLIMEWNRSVCGFGMNINSLYTVHNVYLFGVGTFCLSSLITLIWCAQIFPTVVGISLYFMKYWLEWILLDVFRLQSISHACTWYTLRYKKNFFTIHNEKWHGGGKDK